MLSDHSDLAGSFRWVTFVLVVVLASISDFFNPSVTLDLAFGSQNFQAFGVQDSIPPEFLAFYGGATSTVTVRTNDYPPQTPPDNFPTCTPAKPHPHPSPLENPTAYYFPSAVFEPRFRMRLGPPDLHGMVHRGCFLSNLAVESIDPYQNIDLFPILGSFCRRRSIPDITVLRKH